MDYATATAGAGEWFLPSKDELNEIYNVLVKTTANGGLGCISTSNIYWSSSGDSISKAWRQSFSDGSQDVENLTNTLCVRAVHAF